MRTVVFVAVCIAGAAQAQVPPKIDYQGRLLRADGTAESGVVTMAFVVYDAPTGGTVVGCDALQVALSDGFYAILLGDIGGCVGSLPPIAMSSFDGRDLYLEVAVAGAAMAPRQRIVSVPYAVRAGTAVNVKGGSVDASRVAIGGTTVIDGSGVLAGPAAAAVAPASHTHDAADVSTGTLALARVPQGLGSGLDADKVDGLEGTDLATRSDLATPGTVNAASNPVDWTKLKSVPSGFADGADDGLTSVAVSAPLTGNGTAASPIALNGSVLQVLSARPSTPAAGTFIFNTTTRALELFDGAQWVGFQRMLPRNCKDVLDSGVGTGSGAYLVDPDEAGPLSPVQVYCDMVGDSGGWTLVGKGREGWNWDDAGQGTAAEILNQTTNTVAYLPTAVIRQLMRGQSWNTWTSRLRIIRAGGINDRWFYRPTTALQFSWSVLQDNRHGCGSTPNAGIQGDWRQVGGSNVAGVSELLDNISLTGNDCDRVFTPGWVSHSCVTGFSSGSGCKPLPECWTVGGETHCIAHTTVWIRD